MAKRNRSTSVAPTDVMEMTEIDTLLHDIEGEVPEGFFADEFLAADFGDDTPAEIDPDLVDDFLSLVESLESTETVVEPEPEQIPGGVTASEVIGINKAAFYESQESSTDVSSDEDAAPVTKKGRAKKEAVVKEAKSPKTPRISTAGLSRSATLTAKANLDEMIKIGIAESEIPSLVERIDTLPAKVQDKAYNLLRFAAGRETLSNYTRFVIEQLVEGEQTVPQIVAKMEARGWSPGTSRSQAQQVSRLFRAYEMILTDKGPMRLVQGHPFVANIIDRLSITTLAA